MDLWQRINDAQPNVAREILQRANGSSRWVSLMLARRPFSSADELQSLARSEFLSLGEDDWLEAFSHHPKIGDRAALEQRFPSTHDLSSHEQSGVGSARTDVIDALAEANETYLERFGFIFIVCATGKSAEEMLKMLRDRLGNDRATELRIAAEEQSKITALRLW